MPVALFYQRAGAVSTNGRQSIELTSGRPAPRAAIRAGLINKGFAGAIMGVDTVEASESIL